MSRRSRLTKTARSSRTSSVRKAVLPAILYMAFCTAYILISGRVASSLSPSVEHLERIEAAKGIAFVLITGLLVFAASLMQWERIRKHEIQQERANVALRRRSEFDGVIEQILARFATSAAADVDACVTMSLEEIGRFLGADSAYIFFLSPDRTTWNATHRWVTPGSPDHAADYQNVPAGRFPGDEDNLLAGEIASGTDERPPGAEAEPALSEEAGLRSGILVPLHGPGGGVTGRLVFRSYGRQLNWAEADSARVQLVCEAIANVLEHKRAEESLQQSEKRYHDLVDAMQDIIYSAGPDGTLLFVGPQVQRYGYTAEELVSRPFADIIFPEDREALLREFQHMLDTGEEMMSTFRITAKDGRIVWLEEMGRIVRDAEGNITSISGVLRDITERKLAEVAAQETETRYRALVEQSAMGIGISMGNRIVFANDALLRIFGYDTLEEFARAPLLDHVTPGSRESVAECIRQDEPPAEFEYEIIRRDGETRTLHALTSPASIGDQRCWQTTFADVTDHKRAEKERFEALSRFAGFADASQYGMGMADLDGHIVYVNQALADMLGENSPGDCLGKHFPGTYYPEAMERRLSEEAMPALMSEGHWHGELELRTRDGRSVPTDENYFVIRDEDGVPRYLADILTDITERKHAEEALRRSETQLSDALRMARAGHWEYDVASDTFTFNDTFYLIFRTTAEEVGGFTMSAAEYAHRFCHPDDQHMILEEVRSAIESGDPYYSRQLEHRVIYADGEVGHIAVRFFISKDSQGRTVKTYGVNQDITERVRTEEERARLQAQVQQAQKMEAVGRLAGGIAHDFNNLLTVIVNYADLCREEVDEGHPIRQWLDEITGASQRSASIVRQLLAFARKEAIAPQVINLNEAVAGMLKLLRHLIGEDIDLVWIPGADLWPVKMDPGHVDQLLANLCVNARDAIQGAGRVTVETRTTTLGKNHRPMRVQAAPGDYVVLSVSDTGCGMDEDMLARVFEPFYSTKELGKGTGLGLATVHGIVRQCGGGIDVSSKPDAGTTFRIYLPRTAPVAEDDRPSGDESAVLLHGGETVLLVEDERPLRVTCQLFLEALGYTVLTAAEPEKALRLSSEYSGRIDLLVTDVVMPGMTGHDLAERLASSRPELKRLFISGYTADVIGDQVATGQGGAFLGKPFTRDDLAREVRRILDG